MAVGSASVTFDITHTGQPTAVDLPSYGPVYIFPIVKVTNVSPAALGVSMSSLYSLESPHSSRITTTEPHVLVDSHPPRISSATFRITLQFYGPSLASGYPEVAPVPFRPHSLVDEPATFHPCIISRHLGTHGSSLSLLGSAFCWAAPYRPASPVLVQL